MGGSEPTGSQARLSVRRRRLEGRLHPVLRLCLSILLALAAFPSHAQLVQYVDLGSFDLSTSKQEAIDRGIEQSRWHFGPFHLDPWLSLRDVAWVQDLGDPNVLGENRTPSGSGQPVVATVPC